MNYSRLNEMLTGRTAQRRKLANNTYAERHADGSLGIRLHATEIVTLFPDGTIKAQTGGWKTSTTKERLNQYLPARIWQKQGRWFLGPDNIEFADGITFLPDGKIEGGKPKSDADKEKALDKRIKAFSKAIGDALPLPMPSNGDCFYCAMREVKTGNPLGEHTHNTEHLDSHMDENYFVPSLVWRALEFGGCQPNGGGSAWFWYAFGKLPIKADDKWTRQQITRLVRKYMRRQYGLA